MTGQQPGPRIIIPPEEPRCGYTLVDADGEEYPCDTPAASWRWYQDVGHEDCLNAACEWHENEGGLRLHTAAVLGEQREAVLALHRPCICDRHAHRRECTNCDWVWPCPTARALGITE